MTLRLTIPTCLVLRGLADAADDSDRYGRVLAGRTGLAGGTLYLILRRLETVGAVTATPEVGDPVALKRPLRVFFRLTPAGEKLAERAAARLARLPHITPPA